MNMWRDFVDSNEYWQCYGAWISFGINQQAFGIRKDNRAMVGLERGNRSIMIGYQVCQVRSATGTDIGDTINSFHRSEPVC